MSEPTILNACAINRNVSPGASSAKSHEQLSGPLPVVQVNMTANGPQIQGGKHARPVVVMPLKGRPAPGAPGALPMLQVKMTPGGPQVHRSTVPATSQLRSVARVQVPKAPAPELLTADQLMLCRHLVDKYLGELRANAVADSNSAQVEGSISDD